MTDKAIKVLSLASYNFLPPKMGGQKCIAMFNAYLAQQLDLRCVSVKDNDTSFANYPVKNILSNSKLRYVNPGYFFKLKNIIRTEQVTHLIIEHPYYGWLAILLKWFCKVKLVIHSHNIESLRFKSVGKWWWGILWHYEKFVHRKADLSLFIQDDDRQFAINKFKLDPTKCFITTYGIENKKAPSIEEKKLAKGSICKTFGIDPAEHILLFNGTLNYKPNNDALDIILDKINPALLERDNFKYKIIICGNKLPSHYNELAAYSDKNIIYAGFVEDINLFFKGSDIFINPVIDGGGIKTKVVEALANDLSVISTSSGAIGIPANITGGKLIVVADDNREEFTQQILSANTAAIIPIEFFEQFYWGHIVSKTAEQIRKL